MSGTYKGGFTLLEVVIALTLIAVSFTTLLEVLSFATSKYEEAREVLRDMLVLDKKLKEGNHEGLIVKRKRLPDFPAIEEVIYSYKGLFFVRYEQR
ncbi:type II secretion system protein [Hydrogenivirga sp.]